MNYITLGDNKSLWTTMHMYIDTVMVPVIMSKDFPGNKTAQHSTICPIYSKCQSQLKQDDSMLSWLVSVL